jgi:glycosyltransferase involved in cell wall biosynthesis
VVIGAAGRLEPQKRFDVLINAVAVVRANRPNLKLIIAGDGSLREALAAQAGRLGLGDACRLLGHRTDIVDLHHAFDLFVQSSDYEGTPNAVLEAMALETPLVATDVGGTAEVVRKDIDGLVIPPGNLNALTDAIELVLADRDAAAGRVAAARRRVETALSFEARMTAVEAIYTELFQRRGHRNAARAVSAQT